MIEEYVVEGVNFVAIVPIDTEVCNSPHMEAATITVESSFRKTVPLDGFKLLKERNVTPGVGANLFVWKNGYIGDDKEMKTIRYVDAAKNAGLPTNYVQGLI